MYRLPCAIFQYRICTNQVMDNVNNVLISVGIPENQVMNNFLCPAPSLTPILFFLLLPLPTLPLPLLLLPTPLSTIVRRGDFVAALPSRQPRFLPCNRRISFAGVLVNGRQDDVFFLVGWANSSVPGESRSFQQRGKLQHR